MNTALLNPAKMIAKGAPHVIHNDAELHSYTEALFQLTALENPSPSEEEAIELLTLLIERYEEEHFPVPASSDPISVVRFLIEHGNLRSGVWFQSSARRAGSACSFPGNGTSP